jgi:hypothetical protein
MGTVFWLVKPCAAVHIHGPSKGTSSALKKVHLKIWYFSNRLKDVSPHHTIVFPVPYTRRYVRLRLYLSAHLFCSLFQTYFQPLTQ